MTDNQRACEFEALICEVQGLALETESMKVANKMRELTGHSPAYGETCFHDAADRMGKFAEKFRKLGRK